MCLFFLRTKQSRTLPGWKIRLFHHRKLSSVYWGVAQKRATEDKANELLACFRQDAVRSAIALSLFFQFLLPRHFSLQLQQLLPFLPPFLGMFLFLILSAFLFA
ncbi:MAG: hypothetical protein RLZZ117_2780 [Cyanobacteriota bacterium]